jgi:hypothetical protein
MSAKQLSPTDVGISMDFMRKRASRLAFDIVLGLDDASKLATEFGLSEIQWDVLKHWAPFVQMVRAAQEELTGYTGTATKAQRQAALVMAEVGIMTLSEIALSKNAINGDRLDAIKQITEISGIVNKGGAKGGSVPVSEGGGTIGGPLIAIHMPDPAKVTVKQAPVLPENVVEKNA